MYHFFVVVQPIFTIFTKFEKYVSILIISGAVFNGLNEKLTKFRVRKMNSKITKEFEAISCGIAAATLAFAMMQLIDGKYRKAETKDLNMVFLIVI